MRARVATAKARQAERLFILGPFVAVLPHDPASNRRLERSTA